MSHPATEQMARMGEWVIGADKDAVLACIGLGSCIGLAVVDQRACVAGLAHVMLPAAGDRVDVRVGKYADTAVPALIDDVVAAGARRHRLDAVIVGGARMFALGGGSGLDVGERNAAAVLEALDAARVRVRVQRTGGTRGRTMHVRVGSGEVTCREAAGASESLLAGAVS